MLGKIVEENQKDWDTKVQFVMTAYQASVHEATGNTPNFLTLRRDTRAPLDIVLGQPKEETDLCDSHDSFIADQQERMRIAYAAARENLRRCAERRKKTYELRVRKQKIKSGAWIWYYYPRHWTGRSPKWSRNYVGTMFCHRSDIAYQCLHSKDPVEAADSSRGQS